MRALNQSKKALANIYVIFEGHAYKRSFVENRKGKQMSQSSGLCGVTFIIASWMSRRGDSASGCLRKELMCHDSGRAPNIFNI